MTASLLPIIAAKPVPFVPSSKLPSSAVQKASQRGAAIGRGPIRLRVENAMDELKTAAAAARDARLKSRYAALVIASYLSRTSGKTFSPKRLMSGTKSMNVSSKPPMQVSRSSVAISSATVS